MTSKQLKNSYFTGGVLEAAAVAQAMDRYTDKDIEKLEATVRKMEGIVDALKTKNSQTVERVIRAH